MRPSCKQPAGVVGSPGWGEFNFSVDGVRGRDDRDWTVVILKKKARSPAQSPVLFHNACDLLLVPLSSMIMPGHAAEIQRTPDNYLKYE